MGNVKESVDHERRIVLDGNEQGFATTRFESLLAWARKYSLFQYPFVTACCGMEVMSLNGPRFDGLALPTRPNSSGGAT